MRRHYKQPAGAAASPFYARRGRGVPVSRRPAGLVIWAGVGGGGGGRRGGGGGAGAGRGGGTGCTAGASCAAASARASSPSSVSSSAGLAGASSSSSSEELKPAVGGAHFRRAGGTGSSSLDEPPAVGGPGGLCVTAGAGLISGVAGAGGRGRGACGGVAGGTAPSAGAWESDQTSRSAGLVGKPQCLRRRYPHLEECL